MESRSRSQLEALGLTCVRSQSSREINNATISEFSTFLKINNFREPFLLRLTLFYPIYGYRLSFWAFYAYQLTPLRPSLNPALNNPAQTNKTREALGT